MTTSKIKNRAKATSTKQIYRKSFATKETRNVDIPENVYNNRKI